MPKGFPPAGSRLTANFIPDRVGPIIVKTPPSRSPFHDLLHCEGRALGYRLETEMQLEDNQEGTPWGHYGNLFFSVQAPTESTVQEPKPVSSTEPIQKLTPVS